MTNMLSEVFALCPAHMKNTWLRLISSGLFLKKLNLTHSVMRRWRLWQGGSLRFQGTLAPPTAKSCLVLSPPHWSFSLNAPCVHQNRRAVTVCYSASGTRVKGSRPEFPAACTKDVWHVSLSARPDASTKLASARGEITPAYSQSFCHRLGFDLFGRLR